MTSQPEPPQELVTLLTNLERGNFAEVVGPDKVERLYEFIRTKATPAGGFIVNLSLTEGGHASFVFEILKPTSLFDRLRSINRLALIMSKVLMPTNPGDIITLPDSLKNYPIWWLD